MDKDSMKIKTIIWIDQKISNYENQVYFKLMQEKFKNVNIIACETLEDGIENLLKIKYELVFVCTSGRLYQDYLKKLKEITNDLYCLPISVIFTSNEYKQVLVGLKKNEDSNYPIEDEVRELIFDPFYDPGGILDDYIQVENFLYTFIEKLNLLIDTMNDLTSEGEQDYPTIATKLILKSILSNKNDKVKFTKDEIDRCKEIINQIQYDNTLQPQGFFAKIPITILEKYWKNINANIYEPSDDNLQFSVVELIDKIRDSKQD